VLSHQFTPHVPAGLACEIPSAILEFFEIASECWLFCLAFDQAIILRNPWLPFRKRFRLFVNLILIPSLLPLSGLFGITGLVGEYQQS
jgi:hypothetical protein